MNKKATTASRNFILGMKKRIPVATAYTDNKIHHSILIRSFNACLNRKISLIEFREKYDGTIYEIIWGLIGLLIGFALGFVFELIINRKKLYRKIKNKASTEVFLMIKCFESQSETVEKELYEHFALGVAKINQN